MNIALIGIVFSAVSCSLFNEPHLQTDWGNSQPKARVRRILSSNTTIAEKEALISDLIKNERTLQRVDPENELIYLAITQRMSVSMITKLIEKSTDRDFAFRRDPVNLVLSCCAVNDSYHSKILKCLLEHGASPYSQTNPAGMNAMQIAAEAKNWVALTLLFSYGTPNNEKYFATIDNSFNDGWTLIHFAVASPQKDNVANIIKTIRLLRAKGIEANTRDFRGRRPIDVLSLFRNRLSKSEYSSIETELR